MPQSIKEMVTPLTFARGDEGLIDALRAGHPGAAAVFYERYSTSVHRTLQSVLGRDAEIPDLLQDVFIRAIDRIGELEHLDQVRSWLTTIAVAWLMPSSVVHAAQSRPGNCFGRSATATLL